MRCLPSKCFAAVSFYRLFFSELCFIESTVTAEKVSGKRPRRRPPPPPHPLHLLLHANASPAHRQPFCEPGNQNRDEAAATFSRRRAMFTVQTGAWLRNGPSAEGRSPHRRRRRHLQTCRFSMFSIFRLAPVVTGGHGCCGGLVSATRKSGSVQFVCLFV